MSATAVATAEDVVRTHARTTVDPYACVIAHDPVDQTPLAVDPTARVSTRCENTY